MLEPIHVFCIFIGFLAGALVGCWAQWADMRSQHKDYFDKVEERKKWKQS